MNLVHSNLHRLKALLLGAAILLLGACSTLDRGQAPALEKQAGWVILPFSNATETPLAGSRAEAIAEALLRTRAGKVKHYPTTAEGLFEEGEKKALDDAIEWGRKQGARYGVAGSVYEWRYKVGVDGEPAVGIALQIIDLNNGETVWSASGGKSGWSREALSAVAQQLIRDLLATGLSSL